MTEAKTTTRRRRRGAGAGDAPEGVQAWFAGKATFTAAGWWALLPDLVPELDAWWAEWLQEHAAATPPADAPWIKWEKA